MSIFDVPTGVTAPSRGRGGFLHRLLDPTGLPEDVARRIGSQSILSLGLSLLKASQGVNGLRELPSAFQNALSLRESLAGDARDRRRQSIRDEMAQSRLDAYLRSVDSQIDSREATQENQEEEFQARMDAAKNALGELVNIVGSEDHPMVRKARRGIQMGDLRAPEEILSEVRGEREAEDLQNRQEEFIRETLGPQYAEALDLGLPLSAVPEPDVPEVEEEEPVDPPMTLNQFYTEIEQRMDEVVREQREREKRLRMSRPPTQDDEEGSEPGPFKSFASREYARSKVLQQPDIKFIGKKLIEAGELPEDFFGEGSSSSGEDLKVKARIWAQEAMRSGMSREDIRSSLEKIDGASRKQQKWALDQLVSGRMSIEQVIRELQRRGDL